MTELTRVNSGEPSQKISSRLTWAGMDRLTPIRLRVNQTVRSIENFYFEIETTNEEKPNRDSDDHISIHSFSL